jgi:GH35 family endo-1,4-beta-xylanase
MKNKILLSTTILLCTISILSIAQPAPTGTRLKDIPANLRIGSLVTHGYANNDPNGLIQGTSTNKIATISNNEYNLATATCYPRWDGWATQGTFTTTQFNAVINWFHDRGKFTIMHMLCGPDQYFPDWFVLGNWTPNQQDSLLKSWIYTIIESNNNKEKVNVWNVVNEAFEFDKNDGRYWSNSKVKFHDMGFEEDLSGLSGADKINNEHPIYIRKAFEYAADKTNNILELRENSIEFGGRKAKAFYQLTRHLLNKGVPLGAVGFQCHFDIGAVNLPLLKAEIKKYTDLGIQVFLNEVDIGNTALPFTPAKAEQQKNDFYNLTKVAVETGVAGIVTWGITDNNEFWRTNENCLVFTENFIAKPAYYGIQQALQEAKNTYSTVQTGTYIITAKHSGKVLTLKDASPADGAAIWQYTRNNTLAQHWQITATQGGYHKIISAVSGKGLDVSGISCRDGDLVQQWSFGNGDNQLWKFEKQANGYYKISAKHSDKVLDVAGISNLNEALIQQWRFGGGNNQFWSLEKISDITTATKILLKSELDKFEIFPNPAIGSTQLTYNNIGRHKKASIQITNAQGTAIMQREITLQDGININSINTKGWAKGIYIITLNILQTKKQIKGKLIVK